MKNERGNKIFGMLEKIYCRKQHMGTRERPRECIRDGSRL